MSEVAIYSPLRVWLAFIGLLVVILLITLALVKAGTFEPPKSQTHPRGGRPPVQTNTYNRPPTYEYAPPVTQPYVPPVPRNQLGPITP